MAKKVIFTSQAPAPISVYSQAIQAGGFLFLAGQIPLHPATSELVKGTLAEQAQRVMENLGAVLQQAGASFADVVRATVYLTDIRDLEAFNPIYGSYFPSDPPARTTVQVAALPRGARVEIDVIAYRP